MKQYSKRMVVVHWLTLALLIAAWYFGDSLAKVTDDSKATVGGYIVHMALGGTILLLTLFRLYSRFIDGTPAPVGDTPMDKMAKGIHQLLYTVLFVLPLSGVVIILTSKVGAALLAGDANMLPKKDGYEHVFAHEVHEQLVTVLLVLVVIHLLAAIKHQFITKDGLMERMMLRRK